MQESLESQGPRALGTWNKTNGGWGTDSGARLPVSSSRASRRYVAWLWAKPLFPRLSLSILLCEVEVAMPRSSQLVGLLRGVQE